MLSSVLNQVNFSQARTCIFLPIRLGKSLLVCRGIALSWSFNKLPNVRQEEAGLDEQTT